MNSIKLRELIKDKPVVVPLLLLREYPKLNLQIDEFVLLIYLLDKDQVIFDPSVIASDLKMDMMKVMEFVSNLTDKGLVNLNTRKNDKGIVEDVIDLDPYWTKMEGYIKEELNVKEEKELNIHRIIEEEFNRHLSNFEHEMIDGWEQDNYDKDLIIQAVKEASLNGVTTLRYIDSILSSWRQKGITKVEELKENKDSKVDVPDEIYVGDWLNYDDDEF